MQWIKVRIPFQFFCIKLYYKCFYSLGFLKVTGCATGNAGAKVKIEFYFPVDPGYRDTVSFKMP